jgi:alginate O-acetyltransferase complex protein AlgI
VHEMHRKKVLGVSVVLNLGLLIWFKYAGFLVENLLQLPGMQGAFPVPAIALPIGISFYTFHGISYVVDVYRRITPLQRNPVDMALYISLFPQLIAGPIIRYRQIADQFQERVFRYPAVVQGLQRFLVGLAKKVLIANNLALAADTLWGVSFNDMSQGTAWLGIVCYTLQIYTDFSAYSDMAIGLAALFGFTFPENFNLPYTARSMKDFWGRWHISLSSWFRDYVYIPLGGNRNGNLAMYRNLIVVFLLTGFWHGASWNFLFWGVFHGVFLILERLFLGKWLERLPRIFAHIYAVFVIMMSWVPFRAPDLEAALRFYARLFDFSPFLEHKYNAYIQASLLNSELMLVLLISLLGSAGLFQMFANRLESAAGWKFVVYDALRLAGLLLVFWLCTMNIVAGSYSPFIYFRF